MDESTRKRRNFLKSTAATGAAWAAASVAGDPSAQAAEADVAADSVAAFDVVVVGGGTAGTVAAIQAARAGARTMLVEQSSQLGGTMTTGGVAFPGLFHAWGKQIIAGIGWELVQQTVQLDGGSLPDFSVPPPARQHWLHQVLLNPYLYTVLAEEACVLAGVAIRYYEFPLALEPIEDGWSIEIAGPGTRRRFHCRQLLDCTGGADVVGMLGLERLRDDETQPGSMLYKLDEDFQAGRQRLDAVYVQGADSSNSETRTQANLIGRQAVLGRLRAKSTSSGKRARLAHLQPEAAFRESYRILGETVITHDDYVTGRVFEDAVSFAFYPVDLHTRSGVRPKPLPEGVVPTVPLGALVPQGSRNLIVAGRCLSSDRLANSGLRVQATCMATGQAAGAAAALAAQSRSTPREIPLDNLRNLLREHGAIVP